MKVLHIVLSLDVGGLERMVGDLAQKLTAGGTECHLASIESGRALFRPEDWTGVWQNRSGGVFRNIHALARYVKAHRIDIIHSHNPKAHQWGVTLSLLTGRPLVHTKHGRNDPNHRRRVWLNRQWARFSQAIVAVSDDVARVAVDIERVPAAKVTVIRNGIEPQRYRRENSPPGVVHALRAQWNIGPTSFVVGAVGRFAPEKNYPGLIRSFSRFRRRVLAQRSAGDSSSDPVLLLVGDGPERATIETTLSSEGIREQARLPGMQQDVSPWLHCMDVFCLPSVTEGTSVALLEASASGLPAVATDVGGNGAIVADQVTGLLTAQGDEAAFAEALEWLAANPERRWRMGAAARQRVAEQYSLDAMACAYETLYRQSARPKKARMHDR